MKKKNKSKKLDPAAKEALQRFKYEIANELKASDDGGIKNKLNNHKESVGDYLVNQMISSQQNKMN